MKRIVVLVVVALVVGACGPGDDMAVTVTPGSVPAGSAAEELAASPEAPAPVAATGRGCADVIDVQISGDGPYAFAVTVSSPDVGWEKYADEWRIESESGEILGVRELTHPHVIEQPFTRSLGGAVVEAGTTVVVAARDSVDGYCGERFTVTVGP